jgi:hypothetical protein
MEETLAFSLEKGPSEIVLDVGSMRVAPTLAVLGNQKLSSRRLRFVLERIGRR